VGQNVSKQVTGIIGGGLMGHGMAYLFAAAGHQVGVYEPDADSRASLPVRWRQILDLFEDDLRVLDRITVHSRLAPAIADASFVFEAAPERLALKQRIFAQLESVVSTDTIWPAIARLSLRHR
jgi:3-hydroxybutyryl-CoA dehydrogenase